MNEAELDARMLEPDRTAAAAGRAGLSLGTKVFYGLGSVAAGVVTLSFASSLLTPYLTRVMGLPAMWVGTVIMLTLILDAVIDPVIGHWSDNLRTRWGRRHPLMYAAAAVTAVVVFFFWNSPEGWSKDWLGVYLIVMLVLLRLCTSLYEVPSNALTPELAPDYHERTTLFSYRFFFGAVGSLLMTLVLYRVYLSEEAGGILNRQGYAAYGILAAIVISASMLVSALGTHKEIPRLTQPARRPVTLESTMRELKITLTNRSLLVILASGVLGGIGGGLSSSLSQFFYLELWGLSAKDISNLAIAHFLASLTAVGLAPVLSVRFGKKMFMIVLFGVGTLVQLLPMGLRLVDLMPANSSPFLFPILLVDALISHAMIIMGYIIAASMVADVVEDVAVETGVRSEGLLFSVNGLMPKFTAGFGVFLSGVLLTQVAFPIDAPQGTVGYEVMRNLVIAYLPVNLVLGVLAIGVLSFYQIDKQRHEKNLERLKATLHLEKVAGEADER